MKTFYTLNINRIAKSFQYFVACVAACGLAFTSLQGQDLDVPYVPTPQPVVDKMLELANVQPGDYVIDLGSGDGRIVISAVKRGAYGHGIDLDPERIREARENAESQNLGDQVMFVRENIFETDFSRASVITMYLLNSVNRKLRPQLLEKLEPGTRLVSHSFNMGDWKPDKQAEVSSGSSGRTHDIYYWVIPADVEGDWSWQVNGNNISVSASQQFQEVDLKAGTSSESTTAIQLSEVQLKGKRLSFKMSNNNTTHLYSGRIEGDEITGMVQIYDGEDHSIETWNASRN